MNYKIFETTYSLDDNGFGFRYFIYAVNLLPQIKENKFLSPGNFINLLQSYTLKDQIPDYSLYLRKDDTAYNIWKGWYDLKQKCVKEI